MTHDDKPSHPPPLPKDSGKPPRQNRPRTQKYKSGEPPPLPVEPKQPAPKQPAPKRAAPRSRPLTPASKPDQPARAEKTGALQDHAVSVSEVDDLFTSLKDFLNRELELLPETERCKRALLLHELGHLEELIDHNSARALSFYEQAHQADSSFVPCLRSLRRQYAGQGRWQDVLRVLEAEAKVTPEELRRAALLTQMGEIQVSRLSDGEGAVKSLRAAIVLRPKMRRAADLLRSIYERLERWEDLFEILRGISNVAEQDGERARLLVEMAEICEFRLNRAEEAEELYGQALTLDPSGEAASVALRRLYMAHGRYRDLQNLLTKEAGREHEPDERFADLYRAARIAEWHLQDDIQAASLLETAAALKPADPLPLQALIAINKRTGRYGQLAAVLKRQLRLVQDANDRAMLCFRLGRVYEDWLEQPEDAIKAYQETITHVPGHEAGLRALARLYQRFERWEELLDLELLRAERSRDRARRADGYVWAASIAQRRLNDLRRAVDLYDRAYRMMPGLPEAFRALDGLYRQMGQWEPLAELHESEASVTKDRVLATGLLRTAARIYEEKLDNRQRAIATLEKLLELDLEDRQTMINLVRLYEDAGRVEEQRKCLERWAAVTEDERQRTELQRRIGELLEGPLRRTEQALDVYKEILIREPTDRPTMDRLKAIYERCGRWTDLVDILRAEIEVIGQVPERGPLLFQIGQICRDKLGENDRAQEAFEEALKADPNYTPAMLTLQELIQAQGRWDKLVDLLNATADRIREPIRGAAILCNAGEVCEDHLKDSARAEEFYNRALELDPGHGPARHGLERLYLAANDRNALEAHYLREAEGTSNPELRMRAYLRLGSMFDGQGNDSVGATAAYESALRVMDSQPDALRSLAALLRRNMEWDRLASLLARIAGTSLDREAALAALKEWASIVELHLSDTWDPAPIYERVLDGDPVDAQALSSLDRIAFERGDGDALVSLALRQLDTGDDRQWLASLCNRAALILLNQGEHERAADLLRRGARASPDHLPTIRLLRTLTERMEQWGEAATLMLEEGELTANRELAHAALLRAGNVLIDRLGDVSRARVAFERVFTEDPTNAAAFGRLAAILSANDEWYALVSAYQRRMEVLDPVSRIPLQMELAALYRDNLRDTSAAIEVLRDLLGVDPTHHQALTEISELCAMHDRWRDAEESLATLSQIATDDPEVVRNALLQRCQILGEQLGDEDRALQVLQELLATFPSDREGLERSLVIYRRRGDWERCVNLMEELLRGGTPEERVRMLIELAEIHSSTLQDPQRAGEYLSQAASTCVEGACDVERIIDYFERRGDFEGLVQMLGEALDALPPEGSAGSVAVRLARARVLAGRLMQPGDAEIEIRRALHSDPSSITARLELAGLHLWGDNLGEATAEYTTILDQDPFSLEAYRGLYRVFDRKGDVERASGAAQVVAALADRDVPERKIAAQATAPMEAALTSAVATPLDVHDFWNLIAYQEEPQLARELLYLVADFIPHIIPHELETTADGDVIPLAADDPITIRCRMLAQVFGIEMLECCISQAGSTSVKVLPGAQPALVLDESFVNRSSAAEFRFATGRALARILTRSYYLSVLQPRSVELLLAAVAALFERSYGDLLDREGEVEELTKVVSRAIPRKLRKVLEEPARSYAAGHPVVARVWQEAAQRSAERAGLLLSGDVEAVLNVLTAEQASREIQAELLRFAVGPHLYEARRRLGLAI